MLQRANSNVFYNAHENIGAARRAEAARVGLRWRDAARQQRQVRAQREVVARLSAKAQRYAPQRQHDRLVNALNGGFTGQAPANLRAQRRSEARSRWHRAIDATKPSTAKLLEAVKHAYLALDSAAKAQGYPSLTGMVQYNLSQVIQSVYDRKKAELMAARGGFFAAARFVGQCVRVATGSMMSAPPATLATYIVLRGWEKTCDRYETVRRVSQRVNEQFLAGVDGAMKSAWTRVGREAAWTLPMIFDTYIVKRYLVAWVSKANPGLVRLIDFERVIKALRKNSAITGAVLMGKNVDMLPLVMDVARSLDSCVVQAVIANFLPHGQMSADCRARG